MITSRSRYGLLLLIDLVDHAKEGPVDIASIASRQAIPEAYLAKLLAPLKTAGIIATTRGPGGGLGLAKKAEAISMLEIVEALEGKAGLGGEGEGIVKAEAGDRAGRVWRALDAALRTEMAGRSLADAAVSVIEYHI
ncbi:MAG TPA: Rrf2 family transcriptional regulator [Rectinemataceae bacterium]|nr:Rrf2 family transcriptional regulator [Rectinemataceae bacterium]